MRTESEMPRGPMTTVRRDNASPRASWRALVTTALLLAGCEGSSFSPAVCTTEAPSSIVVTAHDARSGAALSTGTSLILQNGAYVDSVETVRDLPATASGLLGPTSTYERAGTFSVRVRRPGYLLWARDGVQVTADRCHVQTARLDARLEPVP